MNIGLLMICNENDVLERTLAANCEFVDVFYVLDGSADATTALDICSAHPKFGRYHHDVFVGIRDTYYGKPRDGWRQYLLEKAYADHGYDNWFMLLHGDEVWTGLPDNLDNHDGFMFDLPLFFPRAGEEWDYDVHPLDQLRWNLRPGYPEFRMFKGGPDVAFDPRQHNNVVPSGIGRIGKCDKPINHYLYRSPDAQRARAAQHQQSGFDPANYQHITDNDAVYWTDDMIAAYQQQPIWKELAHA